MIGPRTGPMNGAAEKTLIAKPYDKVSNCPACSQHNTHTSFIRGEEISNNATSICKRTGSKRGREESQNEQTIDIRCTGSASIESSESNIRAHKDDLSAVDFGEGSPQQRAKRKSKYEKR